MEQVQKQSSKQETEQEVNNAESVAKTDISAVDDLLDEIDGVLEENAEEFVNNFVQKGGE